MTSLRASSLQSGILALWTVVLVSAFAPLPSVAQKAYDIETFRGSSKDLEVTFNFAVGHGSASDASVLDKTTGRRVSFRYDFDAPFGDVQLVPEDENEVGRLVVSVDPNDLSDHKSLKCNVRFGKKQQVVTLKRSAR